jgi:alanyl-tRNA synthetase
LAANDPAPLFAIAGMNQFKDTFLASKSSHNCGHFVVV